MTALTATSFTKTTTPAGRIHPTEATTEFLAKKAQIDVMLRRLQALSNEHFDAAPDDITWSDVSALGRYSDLLKQVTDMAFSEGEHAA